MIKLGSAGVAPIWFAARTGFLNARRGDAQWLTRIGEKLAQDLGWDRRIRSPDRIGPYGSLGQKPLMDDFRHVLTALLSSVPDSGENAEVGRGGAGCI